MSAAPCYVGLIVRDLARAEAWYTEHLGARVADRDAGWTALELDGGSRIELTAGDPLRPGLSFPSYGAETGPSVMPGFNVDDPDEVAVGLTVARRLPEWIVVVAPDRVRVVLTCNDCDGSRGLVGFRWRTPDPAAQESFLRRIGADGDVEHSDVRGVVPVFAVGRDEAVTDPDGHALQLVTRG
jgi:catechol 2,3-dioxygenase-like lactoylglutathione lyase family enzyme